MVAVVKVTSERKGSNPGGECIVQTPKETWAGYFKYCHGSKIRGRSALRVSHQPIYEAITFQLVKNFGLNTTEFFVLDNEKRDIIFADWKPFMDHDPNGREFYFLSKMVPPQKVYPQSTVERIIAEERPYLDSVLVADVVNKAQNYRYFAYPHSPEKGSITYLDLGCNFVHAAEGYISMSHRLERINAKHFKENIKRLEHTTVLTKKGDELNLAKLVLGLPLLEIPSFNPRSTRKLTSLLSTDEIEEIQIYLAHELTDSIEIFREKCLIVEDYR